MAANQMHPQQVSRLSRIRWGNLLIVMLYCLVVIAFIWFARNEWLELTSSGQRRWATAFLLMVLLTPLIQFLLHGWRCRRQEVLDQFPFEAILLYYQTYEVMSKKQFVEQQTKEYEEAKKKGANDQMNQVMKDTRRDFEDHFDQKYGKRHYLVPIVLLVLVTASLAFLSASFVLDHQPTDQNFANYTADFTVILCLAGAYCWVLYDFVSRERSLDLSTTHVNWGTFRLIVSVPLAYAIPSLWDKSARLAIAFALGTFPTGFLMTLLRRRAGQLVNAPETPESQTSKLEGLPSVNTATADRFREEGITTIAQLASADPVDLVIRTGFSLRFILDCVGEALAWYYLQEEGIKVTRTYSIPGALDVWGLIEELDYDDPGKDAKDPKNKRCIADRELANKVIDAMASKVNGGRAVLERILRCICADSRVNFLSELMGQLRPPSCHDSPACHGGASVARRAAEANTPPPKSTLDPLPAS